MRVSMAGRHMEMTDALRAHVEKCLDKVEGHFDRVIDADVVLSVEKRRHIAEVTLHANGVRIHGKESSSDMYASVDAAVAKLDKQILKYKDRLNRHAARKGAKGVDDGEYFHNIIEMRDAEEPVSEDAPARHRVVLHETLPMKPMNVEEATLQLELSDENFIVFSNADTQQVNVLYTRDDGTFGLIEPQY
jgi:ribosome hibernation promoting factor